MSRVYSSSTSSVSMCFVRRSGPPPNFTPPAAAPLALAPDRPAERLMANEKGGRSALVESQCSQSVIHRRGRRVLDGMQAIAPVGLNGKESAKPTLPH